MANFVEAVPRRTNHANLHRDAKRSETGADPATKLNDSQPVWFGDTVISFRIALVQSLFSYDTKTKVVKQMIENMDWI